MFVKYTKSYLAAIVVAATIAFSPAAHSTVIDFANYADANGEASVGEIGKGYANPLPTDANVPVAGLLLSAVGGVPYLDASSGGQRGGLGVCGGTNGSAQCVPSSDDNVTSLEAITIGLIGGQSFDFRVTEFRNGGHNDISGTTNDLFVEIDNGGFVETTFLNETNTTYLDITSITYAFGDGLSNPDEFYISAIDLTPETSVSEPASLAMFGLGLAGIGYIRRRRTA